MSNTELLKDLTFWCCQIGWEIMGIFETHHSLRSDRDIVTGKPHEPGEEDILFHKILPAQMKSYEELLSKIREIFRVFEERKYSTTRIKGFELKYGPYADPLDEDPLDEDPFCEDDDTTTALAEADLEMESILC